jgi:hypothetical protein
MTRRELGVALGALVIGVAIGAILLRRREPAPVVTVANEVAPSEDLADDSPAGDDGSVAVDDESPRPPAPTPTAAEPATKDAASDAPPSSFRERRLLIHPATNTGLCVEAPPRTSGLQIRMCHGKRNQRWTFVEDPTGASLVLGEGGACLGIGRPNADGEPIMELGPCGASPDRFRVADGHRLEDAHSGQCVTVRHVERRAGLVLEVCNPRNVGQGWTLAQ